MDTNDKSPPSSEALAEALLAMAIESWRVDKVFGRVLDRLDVQEQRKYRSQFRWFLKKVEDALELANMRIVNVEGQPYDPGMAATPINLEEFDNEDDLIVDQMIEPIIMGPSGLLRTGTITLKTEVS